MSDGALSQDEIDALLMGAQDNSDVITGLHKTRKSFKIKYEDNKEIDPVFFQEYKQNMITLTQIIQEQESRIIEMEQNMIKMEKNYKEIHEKYKELCDSILNGF